VYGAPADERPTAHRGAVTALLGTLLVAVPETASAQSVCDSSKPHALKGRPFSDHLAEEARRLSGARSARTVGPGMISSADRVPNRLNVEIDRAGLVTGFWCE
jgi:hypothetical protein